MIPHKNDVHDISNEIHSITLLERRHILLHIYSWPSIILYSIWTHFLINVIGISNLNESVLLIASLICIGILQIFSCLFCHWFITFRSLMNYSKVNMTITLILIKLCK